MEATVHSTAGDKKNFKTGVGQGQQLTLTPQLRNPQVWGQERTMMLSLNNSINGCTVQIDYFLRRCVHE